MGKAANKLLLVLSFYLHFRYMKQNLTLNKSLNENRMSSDQFLSNMPHL